MPKYFSKDISKDKFFLRNRAPVQLFQFHVVPPSDWRDPPGDMPGAGPKGRTSSCCRSPSRSSEIPPQRRHRPPPHYYSEADGTMSKSVVTLTVTSISAKDVALAFSLIFHWDVLLSHQGRDNSHSYQGHLATYRIICAISRRSIYKISQVLVMSIRGRKKGVYVLLSRSQAGACRNFSQPCTENG